jgi:hypothetical protein
MTAVQIVSARMGRSRSRSITGTSMVVATCL